MVTTTVPRPHVQGMETILVVDDMPEIRGVLADQLDALGYVALEAGGGCAALVILAAHPETALMLTDIRMPEMAGTELAARAHALYPELAILLMTGFAVNGWAWPCLRKPFRLTEMAELITATLAPA